MSTYGEYRRNRDGLPHPPPRDALPRPPPPKRRIAPPRDEMFEKRTRKDEEDSRGFRPTMLTFKAFLLAQEDSITDDEALAKYGEYKQEFHRQQLNEFFVAHKEEEWLREKYHPDLLAGRRKLAASAIRQRRDVFMEMFNQGRMKELRLDADRAADIEKLLDYFVLRLEGATEEDAQRLLRGEQLEEELHRSSSIHLRSIPPGVWREELEAVCRKYPGFLRLSLSDPQADRHWARKAWVSFTRKTKIKEICFSLSSVRLRDVDLSPVLNKDLSRRIRSVSLLANDREVMRSDVKAASNLIRLLDKKWDLWDCQVCDILGERSTNPLLENITEHLIEEMSAEEDELLGYTVQEDGQRRVDFSDELAAVLDRLVLYLRMVHSLDFYTATVYQSEDEMPNRCGLFHVRESASIAAEAGGTQAYKEEFSKKLAPLLKIWEMLSDTEAVKLGAKDEAEAVEIFIQANTEELGNDKYLCPLSGKKFKGTDFVRKHIFNKYGEKVDQVKKDVEFFNNFIGDPRRPSLPEKPKSEPRPPVQAEAAYARAEVAAPRGRIKDRLGFRSSTVRVTQAVADPRGMVDYSDVDFADDLF